MDDLWWSLNVLPNIQDRNMGSPISVVNSDQIAHDRSDPAVKPQCSCAGTDKQKSKLGNSPHPTHIYNLYLWKTVPSNKYLMLRYASQILDAELLCY